MVARAFSSAVAGAAEVKSLGVIGAGQMVCEEIGLKKGDINL